MIIDSHAVSCKKFTERSHVLFIQFPPMVTFLQNCRTNHNQGKVVTQSTSSTTRIPHVSFVQQRKLPHPWPFTTAHLFSISRILSSQECYIGGTIQYVTLEDWHFSHSMILQRFVQAVGCINNLFLFFDRQYSMVETYHSFLTIHSLKDIFSDTSFLSMTNKAALNIPVQVFL